MTKFNCHPCRNPKCNYMAGDNEYCHICQPWADKVKELEYQAKKDPNPFCEVCQEEHCEIGGDEYCAMTRVYLKHKNVEKLPLEELYWIYDRVKAIIFDREQKMDEKKLKKEKQNDKNKKRC